MTTQLQSEFDRLAGMAHPADQLLHRIQHGIARRRRTRRRLAMAGAAVAVVALAGGAVLLGPDRPGTAPRPVVAADATPTPTTRELTPTSGSAPTLCVAADYVPDPAPLAAASASGTQNLALAVLPQGWTVARSDATFTMYAAPRDPHRTDFFAGRIVILSGSTDDRPADFHATTTIAGHPAEMSLTDPCSTAAVPGQWNVTLQLSRTRTISVQGPLSLRLDEQQVRDIAGSAVVRQYVPGHG